MHSVVIGPGLGRDPQTQADVEKVIYQIKELGLPLVIDAVSNDEFCFLRLYTAHYYCLVGHGVCYLVKRKAFPDGMN